MDKNWYQRPTPVFFAFLSISLIMAFAAKDMRLGQSASTSYHVFSVNFDYFGMDAQSMEELIALPLEESVMGMAGLMEVETQCQYGQCNTNLYFYPDQDQKSLYLALRDKVDTLYQQLPQAVQRPRIYSAASTTGSSTGGDGTVINLVVPVSKNRGNLRNYLENQLKPLLEGVEGVSQVVVAGGGLEEILVEFQQDRMAAGNINPMALGEIIQESNTLAPGSYLEGGDFHLPLVFDTAIKDINQIRQLPIQTGKGISQLSHFAQINSHQREPEEIVRVQGQECFSLLIKANYDGNLMDISRQCGQILNTSSLNEGDYRILYDRGEEFREIIKNLLVALGQGLVLILLLVPVFFPHRRITLLLLVFLPTTVLWTWGQLQLLGFGLNSHTLSGITIALGLVADTAFVVSEKWIHSGSLYNNILENSPLENRKNKFFAGLPSLQKSMVASTLTTVLVLLPLYYLDAILPGIGEVAVTMGLMVINSLILASVFFPVFLEVGGRPGLFPQIIQDKLCKPIVEKTLSLSAITRARRSICLSVFLVASLLPIFLAWTAGKNLSLNHNFSFLRASVEFPTDTSAKAVDKAVEKFVQEVGKLSGVSFITSQARGGVCQLEIGLEKGSSQLLDKIDGLQHHLSHGQLFLHRQEEKGQNLHSIQVAVVGDESKLCRYYASHCVKEAQKLEGLVQGVMNFKESERVVLVEPQRQELARIGLSLEDVGQALRWLLFGPVVDKWIQSTGEVDIRVVGQGAKTGSTDNGLNLSQLEDMIVPIVASGKVDSAGGAGGLPLGALAKVGLQEGTGTLYRLNGRSCAYFTLDLEASSTEGAKNQVESLLEKVPFQQGYGYHFSREIKDLQKNYGVLTWALVAAIVGIFLLLCALQENIIQALILTILIPASLGLPLVVLALLRKPWESGDLVAMVMVAGLAVNNGIYLMQSTKRYMVIDVREKITSILVTSLSTIVGSIPLMVSRGSSFAASLGFFMVWGTAGSLVISLLVFPAVIDFIFRRYR